VIQRTLTVIAAALAFGALPAGVAQADPADPELCKNGGYASYVNPTTGAPFKNQGRCVSFVNGGGVLVPVQDEPPVPVAPTAKLTVGLFANGVFDVAVEVQGQPNTAFTLSVQSGIAVAETRSVTTNTDGLATFTVGAAPETPLTIRHNGTILGSMTTPAAPVKEPTTPTYTSVQSFRVGDGRSSDMRLGMWCGEGDKWIGVTDVIIPEGATYTVDFALQNSYGPRFASLYVDLSTATDPAMRDGGFNMGYTVQCEDTALPVGY
jgi:hypothetical protein